MLRYDLTSCAGDGSPERLLEMWLYEARRLFRDRLIGKDVEKFDSIVSSCLSYDWSQHGLDTSDTFYVTWGSVTGEQSLQTSAHGKQLGRLNVSDFREVVSKGLTMYGM